VIVRFSPSLVTIDPTNFNVMVEMLGRNFGLASQAAKQGWTSDEALVRGSVDGVPCTTVTRNQGTAGAMLLCAMDASVMRVGFPSVRITVAGQTAEQPLPGAALDRSSSLLLTCKRGAYGRPTPDKLGETCLPCPVCPGGVPCATCPGFQRSPSPTWYADTAAFPAQFAYPQPLPGFYNLNTSDSLRAARVAAGNAGYAEPSAVAGINCPPAVKAGARPPPTGGGFSVAFYYGPNPALLDPKSPFYSPNITSVNCAAQGCTGSEECVGAVCGCGACTVPDASGGCLHRVCVRRDACVVPCEPPEACLGNNFCALGYQSKPPMYRCASCALGFYSSGGVCVKCPDSPAALVVGVVLLLLVVAGAGYWLNKRQVNIAVMSIGIDFFQVLAIFSNLRIAWPPQIRELFRVLSAFNLNIEIVTPECLVPNVTFVTKFMIIVTLPLLIGGFFGVLYLFGVARRFIFLGHRGRKELFTSLSLLVSSLLILMYLLYLYMTRTIIEVFNCAPTTPSDGKLYLTAVFEECTVPISGTQATLMLPAILGLAAYTVGYPAFVAHKLYKYRELVMEDQLLRAKGTGNDRLTNPHALHFRQMYGRSYFQFKPDWYMWVVAIIARKLCISVTAVFNKSAAFQMAACLLIMFLAYAAQVQIHPYMSPADYEGVLKSHEAKAATDPLHARLKANIAGIVHMGRKKVRRDQLVVDGRIDAKAVLGLLGNWLFNYNTVEAIMLFSTVVVCVMALMYTVSGSG
jgi:hypothetical protein